MQSHALVMSLNYTGVEIKAANFQEFWNGDVLVMISGAAQIKDFNSIQQLHQLRAALIPGSILTHKTQEDEVACVEVIAGKEGHVVYDMDSGVIYTHPEVVFVRKQRSGVSQFQTRVISSGCSNCSGMSASSQTSEVGVCMVTFDLSAISHFCHL